MQANKTGGPGKAFPQQRFKKGNGEKTKTHPPGKKKTNPMIHKSKLLATDLEIKELQEKYAHIDEESIKVFADFPLSKKTQKALVEAKFTKPTEVQRLSIGHALQGKDVLGAAITGSGKTLAFLIPILENLYVNKWSRTDGLGAIIISPTRELAYQIFETLKKVGKYHDFSAGLIIGGKNLKFERTRMDQCNILICTPGRLLQHMDENPMFVTTTMHILVLDEADRCLDMGFQKTLNLIIENFPPERQTMLFSATQTNTMQDLERLNLHDPVYVGFSKNNTNGKTDIATTSAILAVPKLLQQSYVVLPLEEKLTMLWSFIKNHLKQKTIVFVSSCKQAKYLYEIFCKLRPGVSLLSLYGTLHQDRRIAIYEDFLRKNHVVMFATDIASRGLDFPAVNWVVQLDCPEDVAQYIHRAGRSARNKTRGESLLVLTPSEEEYMIGALEKELNLSIICVHIDPKKLFSPRVKIEAFLAQFNELRTSAQRAFVAYLKSVFLMRNKHLFNVLNIDLDAFAQSLGLAVTPRVPFLEKLKWRLQNKNSSGDGGASTSVVLTSKSQNFSLKTHEENEEDEDDDDFIKLKRRDHAVECNESDDIEEITTKNEDDKEKPLTVPKREKLVTKAAMAKKAIKKDIQVNLKLKFGDDGEALLNERNQMKSLAAKNTHQSKDDDGGISIVLSKALLNEEDEYDKQRFRQLVKKRHKLEREKLKKKAEKQHLAHSDSDEDEEDADDSDVESENSVDLSWLPNPDKIYTKKRKDDDAAVKDSASVEDNSESEAEDESNDDDEPVFKKSKLTQKLTLDETEAIAANLLGF